MFSSIRVCMYAVQHVYIYTCTCNTVCRAAGNTCTPLIGLLMIPHKIHVYIHVRCQRVSTKPLCCYNLSTTCDKNNFAFLLCVFVLCQCK